MEVPFIDLIRKDRYIKNNLRKSSNKIFNKINFILGEEVELFENKFAVGIRAYNACLWNREGERSNYSSE